MTSQNRILKFKQKRKNAPYFMKQKVHRLSGATGHQLEGVFSWKEFHHHACQKKPLMNIKAPMIFNQYVAQNCISEPIILDCKFIHKFYITIQYISLFINKFHLKTNKIIFLIFYITIF